MAEKKIELQEIDPVEIFGVNDRFITRLGNYFPKLKIVARGNCISLKGSSKDIAEFSKAIDARYPIQCYRILYDYRAKSKFLWACSSQRNILPQFQYLFLTT